MTFANRFLVRHDLCAHLCAVEAYVGSLDELTREGSSERAQPNVGPPQDPGISSKCGMVILLMYNRKYCGSHKVRK